MSINHLHIAIIMDGNRRYAKKRGLSVDCGHRRGADKIEEILDWCIELKIKELTLYTFSTENFKRKKDEVNFLMHLFQERFHRLIDDERVSKNRIKIRFIGKISMLPKKVRDEISAVEKKTARFSGYFLNFAIAYGGRQEILDAAREIARKAASGKINPERINEKVFESYLLLKSKPDIVIRTAGDLRTSNFLPWQSAYSEWFFLKNSWPEFRKSSLKKIISEFRERKRNFGR